MTDRTQLHREVDRLLDGLSWLVDDGVGHARAFTRRHGIRHAMDLYDTGTDLVLKVLLPGAKPYDINISIEKKTVILQGDYDHAMDADEAKCVIWYRREIGPAHVTDAIPLPVEVEADRATAMFSDGILTLSLPKVPQERSRRIPVQAQTGHKGPPEWPPAGEPGGGAAGESLAGRQVAVASAQRMNIMNSLITARDLSRAYTQAVSAYWRGESASLPEFEAWLAHFWTDGPPEPVSGPAARCPHGAAGRGIRWHECGSAILGYVPGKQGCFRVPRTAMLPTDSGRATPALRPSAMAA